ncbi:ATP-binding cassette domain-containing protein [Gordonia jinghuaiqii]|uniref:Dipeptide/oligopeptide/nickel ABC transporter permease/ATP-binding protein n=1 Tax=Gordonia jinghuaiqii TaxID=2758710 RepID=A0A7D7QY80_9ACTN|nr:dipeptide/oligopeptide/nickel ABC transporter permease/ATP-binding protein [Gordonia jinghuaiqii]MCR5980304.1 ATP-binding cassette domain-containing protein [Gordonia jinghuaiqii]QMT01948.1 dipeptide/oligopeptide/nickel ABC transporter permease/ATP-binding protein [Gordonia jinghuaiqii]
MKRATDVQRGGPTVSSRSRTSAIVGASILGVLAVCAIFAPWISPHDPGERVTRPFARPSGDHWLGSDDAGHDLLSMLLHGAKISLTVGIIAGLAATVIGALVGIIAGYCRGTIDAVLMRITDVVLSLPVLPLTIVIGVFIGPGLTTQILVISAVLWAGLARELRSQVLSLRERDHLQALRSMGATTPYVLRRHVFPAVVPLVVPQFILATKTAVLLEASLSFLGLGDISAPSWGSMLSLAHQRSAFLTDAWMWWVVPPGIAIAATVLGFALIGNALEERSRPMLVRRKKLSRRSVPQRIVAGMPDADAPPLRISHLSVSYSEDGRPTVDDVSLTAKAGEIVAVVGESGSGKSTVAAVTVGLLSPAGEITAGSVEICGRDVAAMRPGELRAMRGNDIALIPQEAMSALDPVQRIGDQLIEAICVHRDATREEARARAVELLGLVGIDAGRIGAYPHELSGGMRQRVVIAIALANDPTVLVADEPTSGLDVLVEVEVLDLLARLRDELGLTVLLVSHNLAAVERIADTIAVMYDGRIIESGPTAALMADPQQEHTRDLLGALLRLQPAATELVGS